MTLNTLNDFQKAVIEELVKLDYSMRNIQSNYATLVELFDSFDDFKDCPTQAAYYYLYLVESISDFGYSDVSIVNSYTDDIDTCCCNLTEARKRCKRRLTEGGELSKVSGTFSSLIAKHNAELDAIATSRDRPDVKKQRLIDLVTIMLDEAKQPTVINYIDNTVLPKLESMTFEKGLSYIYSGIFLKGEKLSMGKLYDRNRMY